ncbi:U4/U6 x U5 tri-snRNP complex subunit Prp1 [Coemansia sp. RSA 1694]|nr:U4/U6 x U5 tri-snRNP complex subunit Prp1 [Coemansia sp. RSA 1694]
MFAVTKDFLGKLAPPGYVAGLGRGATGFTTRSDIGPAREAANAANAAKAAGNASGNANANADRFKDAENEEGLFSGMAYGADDEEADQVWTQIDAKMAQRRQGKRKDEAANEEKEPPIGEHLRDAKRQLQTLTADEWEAIPDVAQVAETAARAKRRRTATANGNNARLAQVPDSALVGVLGGAMAALDPRSDGGAATDLRALGQARDAVLRMKLDSAAGQATTTRNSADAAGYLTSLATSSQSGVVGGIGDVARARRLLKSPMGERSAAAASVLERAVACQPQCETLWLALADCSKSDNKSADDAAAWGRGVLERAFAANPASEAIVLAAVALEADAGQHARAVALLERATSIKSGDGGGGSPRVWLKAAVLQRRLGNLQAALEAARRGRELFPNADGVTYKLWLIESQVHQQMGDAKTARQTLALALAQSPRLSAELWISAAALDAAQEQGSARWW